MIKQSFRGVLLGLVVVLGGLLACKSKDTAPEGMVKVTCSKKVKGEMFVPKDHEICGSGYTYDCFQWKDAKTNWMISASTGPGPASSKEEAAKLAKGSSQNEWPFTSRVEELGPGDYLVPMAECSTCTNARAYRRLVGEAEISCTGFGKTTSDLAFMAKLKEACKSYKPAG